MKLSMSDSQSLLSQSDIRVMSLECEKAGGINLSQGICDLDTPPVVLEGAKKAIDSGLNYYTRFDGIEGLRKAISKKLLSFNSINASPDSEIIVSGGATGALFCACLALLKPGDEVILFEPFYGYHLHTLLAVGAKPVFVKTHPPNWDFSQKDLEFAATPKTKGIIINTPSNPSGKVFSREELGIIADLCEKHDIIAFTDEIYEYFVYGGAKHVSPASIPKMRERTVTVSGYSKTYSTTGWRIGYCACNAEWAEKIGQINDLLYVCAPSPLQQGIADGIDTLPQSFYSSIGKSYQKKRDMVCDALSKACLHPHIPAGAYYILADAASLPGIDSKEKAMGLLAKTGVATVPGRAFYHDSGGDMLLRVCFAKKDSELELACERLAKL